MGVEKVSPRQKRVSSRKVAEDAVQDADKVSKRSDRSKASKDSIPVRWGANLMAIEQTGETKEVANSAAGGRLDSDDLVPKETEEEKMMRVASFKVTKLNCRGRIHDLCDEMELAGDMMLKDALLHKTSRLKVLNRRQKLLRSLWNFRDIADCEDDFSNEEFHSEMRMLATVQRKLGSLDSKISALMTGAEQSSSDSEGDGEIDELSKLKNARQNLRYALGEGTVPAA